MRLLKTKEVAVFLGVSEITLRRWRLSGRGPEFVKMKTGSVRYRPEFIEKYLDDSKRISTSNPGHERR